MLFQCEGLQTVAQSFADHLDDEKRYGAGKGGRSLVCILRFVDPKAVVLS